ncbi:MAG: hybrid sensor histidine kinase/response regulator [Deltaproteobacteria bacterium]|jgi:signal transduction histidine kinase|nr:hybrid sensor histidine kinase/response regulator [Deltaproteobacteria bacterium]MBT4268592.1 hybrid sensor histidine kinase/response regulator [Deltaproteobacteria bacterium]MBT4643785.1 hybrid sensor histidine kinase/response regulator [Deltaproteobacteria bacterium]MBT6504077.1 hybrid sensor histidine kinase/response regulator [Deltaproteobacteria bacterium]MBT6613564.1 hybrid sensor histidine kinase/response regulator [Deltaproteobacteria bacterium]
MKNIKILIVDDEESVRDAYRSVFKQMNGRSLVEQELKSDADALFGVQSAGCDESVDRFQVVLHTAEEGEEGIKVVKESIKDGFPFSVAFIDMRMPGGMDGLETAHHILAIDSRIELVFVTAYSDYTLEEIGRFIGKSRFFILKKPFDVQEIMQMAETLALRWETERERELLEYEKEQFIRNMSHEVRQPIHIISNACNALLSHQPSSTQRDKFINYINQETQRLMRLLENLKDINQMDSSNDQQRFEKVNVDLLCRKVVELLSADAEKKGINLILQSEVETNCVLADTDKLMQVLVNLTVNAIKYTENGSIRLYLLEVDGSVEIAVEDTGCGITPEEQDKIFKRFYRCRSTSSLTRGYGLGLSISQEIVRRFGSEIKVSSSPGKGSRFSFKMQSIPCV